MDIICNSQLCTGCGACYNRCSQTAISMKEDDYGFLHPIINKALCIDCGACIKVCPVIVKTQLSKEIKTYAAVTKDEEIHMQSTSGGVATTLSKFVIESGGVVYGASFDKKINLKHIRVSCVDCLYKLQGSKYVQSNIDLVFRQISKDLCSKRVLFIGTPCQVAGLENYISPKYKKNLLTLSFICGGVPSQRFLKENLSFLLNNAVDLKFRNGTDYGFFIYYPDKEFIIKRNDSRYFRGFDKKVTLRQSCYNCRFATRNRVGDITIGDFWGLNSGELIKAYKKIGISIIICSTNKGVEFIKETNSLFKLEEHDIEETEKYNPRLLSPADKPKRFTLFRGLYKITNNFNFSINMVLGLTYLKYKIKNSLKRMSLLEKIYHLKLQNNAQ